MFSDLFEEPGLRVVAIVDTQCAEARCLIDSSELIEALARSAYTENEFHIERHRKGASAGLGPGDTFSVTPVRIYKQVGRKSALECCGFLIVVTLAVRERLCNLLVRFWKLSTVV